MTHEDMIKAMELSCQDQVNLLNEAARRTCEEDS